MHQQTREDIIQRQQRELLELSTPVMKLWKGVLAVHSWVVIKRKDATRWTRFDVVGWGNPVRRNSQPPDGRWYSNQPVIIHEIKGPDAARLLPKVEAAPSPGPIKHAVYEQERTERRQPPSLRKVTAEMQQAGNGDQRQREQAGRWQRGKCAGNHGRPA